MKVKVKDLLNISNMFNIWPDESKYYKRLLEKIKSDNKKSDEELLKSDWEEIGKDFDKIIPRD